MADENLTRLADPATAIASYLDDLLHTATDTALREETVRQEDVREAPRVESEPQLKPAPQVPPLTRTPQSWEVEKTAPQPESAEVAVDEQPARETPAARIGARNAEVPEPQAPVALSQPDWSGAPFECLIFTVAGLQLAVPLVLLGAIHRIEEEIRPIPGSPRWYMGIRPASDMNLRVVDTAEWIMAGRVPDNARDNYKFVIRLDNSEWGLACDDVAQSFTLRPDEVRWRTSRSKRPWLAGTVIDHMCALIDVRSMADLLVRAEREHHLDLS